VGLGVSQAVIHNGIVYLAGQVATGARGGSVAEQTKDVLSNIDVLLAEANSNKGRILSATIGLTDMAAFSDMNEVWEAWIVPGAPPARAAVASPEVASQDFKLEVSVIAAQS
jgi:enamine deaminase RidA (YjgF/YER057c/UK114 family)